jgi:hypothetical protein
MMSLGHLADIDTNITVTLFPLSRSLAFILHRSVRDFDERLTIFFTHSCDISLLSSIFTTCRRLSQLLLVNDT